MKHIFLHFAVLAASLVAASLVTVSCAAELAAEQEDVSGDDLIVAGNVYNIKSGKPLRDIMIVMSSYERFDTGKKYPQYRDTSYTSSKGYYRISVPCNSEDGFYDIRAVDVDGTKNGGSFEDAWIDYIEWNGKDNPLYDQDIYMQKK